MRRFKPADYAPLGLDYLRELRGFFLGLLAGAVYSGSFLLRFYQSYRSLFQWSYGERMLLPGARMPDFSQLVHGSFLIFAALALVMPALIAWHYLYHRQGAKSIYLMRRLPNPWELHRRCLVLPLAGMLLCLLAAVLLLLLYFGLYLWLTPPECLPLGREQKIWSILWSIL